MNEKDSFITPEEHFSLVKDKEGIENIIGKPPEIVWFKSVYSFDEGCRTILAASFIAGFGYKDIEGHPYTTFVGGQTGFPKIESNTKFSFDLPLSEPRPLVGIGVSFVFFIKGISETLRLNGVVYSSEDCRVTITMKEAYIHCARAILRSNLWRPKPNSQIQSYLKESSTNSEGLQNQQVLDFLDSSPFLILSSWDGADSGDTSPRGDPSGFLRVIAPNILFMPDRRGNQRADTFHNLMSFNEVSFAALTPGINEVLHLRANAEMTNDPRILSGSILTEQPKAGTLFHIKSIQIKHNIAMTEANFWLPSDNTQIIQDLDLNIIAMKQALLNKGIQKMPAIVRLLIKFLANSPRTIGFLMNIMNKQAMKSEGYTQHYKLNSAIVKQNIVDMLIKKMPNQFRTNLKKSTLNLSTYLDNFAEKIEIDQPLELSTISEQSKYLQVVEVIRETENAVSIHFEDPKGHLFNFKAGQYFTITLEIDGKKIRRSYSASSIPNNKRLSLTVKRVSNGLCSNFINDHLKPGDFIEVRGPSGTFFVEPKIDISRDLVLISGGSGITPIISIIQTILEFEPLTKIKLIYGNRSESEIIFKDKLNSLILSFPDRIEVRHVLENAPPDWKGGTGILNHAKIEKELSQISYSNNTEFYICGPTPLMTSAKETLLKMKISPENIYEEKFSSGSINYIPNPVTSKQSQNLTVMKGTEKIASLIVEPSRKLLDASLDADLPMPFSCGMGNCGECKVRLIRGKVEMSKPNCLSEADLANGYILTCVSKPISDIEIDIADQGKIK